MSKADNLEQLVEEHSTIKQAMRIERNANGKSELYWELYDNAVHKWDDVCFADFQRHKDRT